MLVKVTNSGNQYSTEQEHIRFLIGHLAFLLLHDRTLSVAWL